MEAPGSRVNPSPDPRKRIEELGFFGSGDIRFHEYNKLQLSSRCALSDSGTISEGSSLLGFPAIALRDSIERPEALDSGAIVMTGLNVEDVIDAIRLQVAANAETQTLPDGYEIDDPSARVARSIQSTSRRHATWAGLRTTIAG